MWSATSLFKKSTNILLSLVLVSAQLVPLLIFTERAYAADVCTNDVQGANDEPGQKDLTLFCIDDSTPAEYEDIYWQWDELGTTGKNTMDACALIDTDGDGKANYAVCVTTQDNDPALFNTQTIYSCGDERPDRCTQPATPLTGPFAIQNCIVSQVAADPFAAGADYPEDTRADCRIYLSDFGGASVATLTDVCSYPSQQPNSDPSDCVITPTDNSTGSIEIIKELDPDVGTFNLRIGSTTYATGGDGTTTGPITVDAATGIQVSETGANGTLLSNYTTYVECVADGQVLPNAGTRTGESSRTISVDVGDNDEVVCTFTNTFKTGTLRVVKDVVNDNGGTLDYTDFTFDVDGSGDYSFNESVTPDGVRELTVPIGSYTVTENEANQNGYSTSYSNCTSVAVTHNQISTCTITNDDIAPTLTLVKSVTNDDGGNALPDAFSLTVGGNPVLSGVENTYQANTPLAINETVVDGYEFVSITGDAKCPDELGGTITLAPGDDVTCTITNNDVSPELTIIKKVVNDNGGSLGANDFGIQIDTTDVVFGAGTVENSTTTYTKATPINANTDYVVSETETSGYTEGTWSCNDGTNGTGLTVTVNLDEGEKVSCTIINDDTAPQLKLVKIVVNDDGGTEIASAWTLIAQAGESDPLISEQGEIVDGSDGLEAETDSVDATAGIFYTLSEQGPDGYTGGDWSCDGGTGYDNQLINTVVLMLGESVTCTITNDDEQAYIIVDKTVINDNGGTALANDFELKVNGNLVLDGVAYPVNPGMHTVTETNLPGYTAGSWGGDCSAGGSVTVALGETKTCTITNNDQQAYITVVKKVINDNGGSADPDDFNLTLEGNAVDSGDAVAVTPGTYTADETQLDGYTFTGFSGNCDENGDITVALGESKTCTLTNDDEQAYIIVDKTVINDNGGTAVADDFDLMVNDNNVLDEVAYPVDPGTHTVSETQLAGYSAGPWGTDCSEGGSVTIALGETKTCTITNDDESPIVIVTKYVESVNEYDETFSFELNNEGNVHEFDITLTSPESEDSVTLDDLAAGEIQLTELEKEGWVNDYLYCESEDYEYYGVSEFVAENGKTYYCYVRNSELSTVIVTKINDTNMNGEWDEDETTLSDWEMNLKLDNCNEIVSLRQAIGNECDVLEHMSWSELTDEYGEAQFSNLESGHYELSETLKDGWVQTGIYCEDNTYEPSFETLLSEEVVNSESFHLWAGETRNCYVLNTRIEVDVEVDKDDKGVNTQAGGQFDYTIDVKNNAELFAATDVIVTDELNNNLKLVSYTGTDWICEVTGADSNGFGGTVTCEYQKELAAGASAPTITFRVEVSAGITLTSIDNLVRVTSKELDIDLTNNEDTENTPVTKPQVLGVVKVTELPKTGQSPMVSIYAGLLIALVAIVLGKSTIAQKR